MSRRSAEGEHGAGSTARAAGAGSGARVASVHPLLAWPPVVEHGTGDDVAVREEATPTGWFGRARAGTVACMRLTVLGGSGAWPAPGGACSGYLLEHAGFRLLLDPGYATVPRLLELLDATALDAVLVTHGHPDHCADLNPLLRARIMLPGDTPALRVYAPDGALDRVLALEPGPMLEGSYTLHDLAAATAIGPFAVRTVPLPHFVPDLGVRLTVDGAALAYTGDAAPDDALPELARDADLLLAEASFVDTVPPAQRSGLNTATTAGRQAATARVRRLVLTHLFPTTDPVAARDAASATFGGPVDVAVPGLRIQLG
jgi:ribonuclease BN (tRNA processing enzyme)